jgi:hypothetical protein
MQFSHSDSHSVSVCSSQSIGRPNTLIRAAISLSLYSTSSHGAVGRVTPSRLPAIGMAVDGRFSVGTFIMQFIVTIYWR